MKKIFYFYEFCYIQSTSFISLENIILFYLVESLKNEETLSTSLIQQIINQIMLLRDGVVSEIFQIKNLIELLEFTKVYKQEFEREFLKLTGFYFKSKVLNFSEKFEIREYLNFLNKTFKEEKELSEKLMLSSHSSKKIVIVLEEEFILNNIKNMFEFGFSKLIEENDFEYLKLFYYFLEKVDKIDFVKINFNDYIKKIGTNLITNEIKNENLIQSIIEFREKMLSIVEKSFDNSKKIKTTLDYAFQYFINLKTNNLAEITSKYMDDLLKKEKIRQEKRKMIIS